MLNPNAIEFKPHPATEQPKSESSQSSRRSSKATSHGKRPIQVTNTGNSSSSTKQKKKQQQHVKQQQQQQQPSRRKGRTESLPVSKESLQHSIFDQPAKFITIEETIDPLCQLSIKDRSEKKIVHGYERYIEWIGQSLKAFDTVTIVGMDNAIADVVSLVNIMQQRGIGEHEEVETFTLQ